MKLLFKLFLYLFPPKNWLFSWLRDKHGGSIKLDNNTWVVNQTDDFHKYCYDVAYKKYKKNN